MQIGPRDNDARTTVRKLWQNTRRYLLLPRALLTVGTSPLFNRRYYRSRYPDLAAWRFPVLLHYLMFGEAEDRCPSKSFDPVAYVAANPDVGGGRAVFVLEHFIRFGRKEKRSNGHWNTQPVAAPPSVFQSELMKAISHSEHALDYSKQRAIKPCVNVVVCVHNALSHVKLCLTSLEKQTKVPFRLVIVDDGSDASTQTFLVEFSKKHGACLIRNETAQGYTRAANAGIKTMSADYYVLLNSDTEVPSGWLQRMMRCAESAPHIGMVSPISNAASWQSIPYIRDPITGDWCVNPLPEGMSTDDYASLIAKGARCVYPRLPVLNGFCLLIKNELIQQIGLMDEHMFAQGYGEENDYALRTADAGWEMAVADDVYVFHAHSKSYTTEKRLVLCRLADDQLVSKHGAHRVAGLVNTCRESFAMEGVRAWANALLKRDRCIEDGRQRWQGARVAVVLPVVEAGGGANVVLQLFSAMRRMGVTADIINIADRRDQCTRAYPGERILYVDSPRDIPELMSQYDAVLATYFESVFWMGKKSVAIPGCVRGYLVQDFEPAFFQRGSPEYARALASYTHHTDMVLLCLSDWNRRMVLEQTGRHVNVIGPTCNVDVFHPARDRGAGLLTVAAMVRPATPRRNAKGTMRILKRFKDTWSERVRIVLFGCAGHEPEFLELERDFDFTNCGVLDSKQLASVLNHVDVFADFSHFQAMGLTALEAMACGVAIIVPLNGGSDSFAYHGHNALVVDTASEEACLNALNEFMVTDGKHHVFGRNGLCDAVDFFPERSAYRLLETLLAAQKTVSVQAATR